MTNLRNIRTNGDTPRNGKAGTFALSNGVKKILFFVLLLSPLTAFAQTTGFVPLAPIPGLTQGATADTAGLATFFNNLYKYLIGLSAALAVIMIIWEGIRIATNRDNVSILTDSKGKIYNAIFGLVLVLSPVLVFSVINPSILNLSINLQPLNTTSTGPGGGPGVTSFCSGQTTTNCIPLPPSAGGRAQTPVPGWWCYERVDNAYWCVETYAGCFNHLTDTTGTSASAEPKPGSTCTQTPGTPPPTTGDGCSVTGQAGFLQKALCSTDAAANRWASECPWRVSGRTEVCLTQDSSGCTQKTIALYCENKIGPLVFVDIGKKNSTNYNLQPINASAAATFQPFKTGCENSTGRVCTVGLKTAASVNCNDFGGYTASLPGDVSGKCYNVPIYCYSQEDADKANSYFHLNPFSSVNYDVCTPDVTFTPQSIQ